MMTSLAYLVLVFAGFSSSVFGKPNKQGVPECEECSFLVDDAIEDVQELLEQISPLKFEIADLCNECEILGFNSFQRNGSACVKRRANCYTQNLTLHFSKLSLKCKCPLPTSLQDLDAVLRKKVNTTPRTFCTLPAGVKEDNSKINQLLKPLNDTRACDPTGNAPKSLNKNEMAVITSSWDNVNVGVIFRYCKNKSLEIRNLEILNNDYDNIKIDCKCSETEKNVCNCISESSVTKFIILKDVGHAFSCATNNKIRDVRELAEKLRCQ